MKMRYWGFIVAFLLASCAAQLTPLPLSTETPIPNTSTPQIIEVTRVIKIEQTIVVTVTPEPLLAQECFNNAVTQSDLNSCAAEERFTAQDQLDEIISRIRLSSEDKQEFDKLQKEWDNVIVQNCMFYYEKWRSMRPMQQSMCIAQRIKEHIQELEITYLTPDG